jgi:hypothetical protein
MTERKLKTVRARIEALVARYDAARTRPDRRTGVGVGRERDSMRPNASYQSVAADGADAPPLGRIGEHPLSGIC